MAETNESNGDAAEPQVAPEKTEESRSEKTSGQIDCFVMMPFTDPDGYEKGHFRRVYDDLISPACKQAGFEVDRVDAGPASTMIHLDLVRSLLDAPMAICDLSGLNPNVAFELGIRQAFDQPVTLIKDERTPRMFDVNGISSIGYDSDLRYDHVVEAQAEISASLKETYENRNNTSVVNSIVRLLAMERATLPHPTGNAIELKMDLLLATLGELRASSKPSGSKPSMHRVMEANRSKAKDVVQEANLFIECMEEGWLSEAERRTAARLYETAATLAGDDFITNSSRRQLEAAMAKLKSLS